MADRQRMGWLEGQGGGPRRSSGPCLWLEYVAGSGSAWWTMGDVGRGMEEDGCEEERD